MTDGCDDGCGDGRGDDGCGGRRRCPVCRPHASQADQLPGEVPRDTNPLFATGLHVSTTLVTRPLCRFGHVQGPRVGWPSPFVVVIPNLAR